MDWLEGLAQGLPSVFCLEFVRSDFGLYPSWRLGLPSPRSVGSSSPRFSLEPRALPTQPRLHPAPSSDSGPPGKIWALLLPTPSSLSDSVASPSKAHSHSKAASWPDLQDACPPLPAAVPRPGALPQLCADPSHLPQMLVCLLLVGGFLWGFLEGVAHGTLRGWGS